MNARIVRATVHAQMQQKCEKLGKDQNALLASSINLYVIQWYFGDFRDYWGKCNESAPATSAKGYAPKPEPKCQRPDVKEVNDTAQWQEISV